MLNIGLHAQTLDRADGIIAGSEVTTLGLKKAFEQRNDVNKVSRYGPGNYKSLDTDELDLVIIEGWHATLPQFIQKVRRYHPRSTILFWNLSFMGIQEIVKLDLDGYLTNSRKMVPFLEKIAPTRFLLLAADPDEYAPGVGEEKYIHNVTYLGIFHLSKTPAIIERMLCEAVDYGLAIYGAGWGHHPILKPYWKGKLPFEEIPMLYRSVKIVLGMTEKCQKIAGMINNRVFEALACGTCFISDYYPGLEEIFHETILYSRKSGDTSRYLERVLQDVSYRKRLGKRGREEILTHHTYHHRSEKILDFHRRIKEGKTQEKL